MSEINYQALREAAEKATCGEWSLEYGESRFDGDYALIHREVAGYIPICRIEGAHPESGFDEDFQMEQQANAEFIAAANLNRPGFPGECFICELRLPDHRFRWKHNKLFLLLPEEYGPAFPAIVDCYTSPPT